MTDAKYIRPEDRLYYAAGALKSPSTTPERRRQYLAEAEDAVVGAVEQPVERRAVLERGFLGDWSVGAVFALVALKGVGVE